MTAVTAFSDDVGTRMVGISRKETRRGMTVLALCSGYDVRIMLAHRHSPVVAAGAYPGDTGMIKTAIRVQFQERRGIVAVVTLAIGRRMELGFSNRDYTIMALATGTKDLIMIIERNDGKTLRRMAGLAVVAGRHVGWRLCLR